jgi:hypothetical protein
MAAVVLAGFRSAAKTGEFPVSHMQTSRRMGGARLAAIAAEHVLADDLES